MGVLTALQPVRDVLPRVNAGSLASAVMPIRPTGVESPGVNNVVADGRALATVVVYVVVGLLVALWIARRREVA